MFYLSLIFVCHAVLLQATECNAIVENSTIIGITGSGERVSEPCIDETLTAPLSGNLSSITRSNTHFKLCWKENNSTGLIKIEDVSNIALTGFYRPSIIKCSKTSGFLFKFVRNLTINGIVFINCGIKIEDGFTGALNIINGLNIFLSNVHIWNSPGIGLVLSNVGGSVTIEHSEFSQSGCHGDTGGSGMLIKLDDIALSECIQDIDINQSNEQMYDNTGDFDGTTYSDDRILMTRTKFTSNRARGNGGGLNISIGDTSFFAIEIQDCEFTDNFSPHKGGGMHIEYDPDIASTNFSFIIKSTIFRNNSADIGGGTSIYLSRTENKNSTHIRFKNATWINNTAKFGSAISLLPKEEYTERSRGHLPKIAFDVLTMESNKIKVRKDQGEMSYEEYTDGGGGLYCSNYIINMKGDSRISENDGSAFYLAYCQIHCDENTTILFESNSGYYGGAIYLLSSEIIVSSDTLLTFSNNAAFLSGGALHFYSQELIFSSYSRICFIRRKATSNPATINFIFENNRAYASKLGRNNSIHALSILPCTKELNASIHDIFSKIGTFKFIPESSNTITTGAGNSRFLTQPEYIDVIPGKSTALKIESWDDFNRNSNPIYLATIRDNDVQVKYPYISKQTKLVLIGRVGSIVQVSLSTLSSRRLIATFPARLVECPPGYVMIRDRCKCSVLTAQESRYYGIATCNLSDFTTKRIRGFWIGYLSNEAESDETLRTGYCPLGYCSKNETLPKNAKALLISRKICTDNREGFLCAQCIENFSVYYNGLSFKCGKNDLCSIGWLFYILGVILPITLVFTVILLWDISLTTGLVNGFIFFAQVVEYIDTTVGDVIDFPPALQNLTSIHQTLYRMFQLDFFTAEALAFCIWKNANTLNILALKYVALIYTLVLIVGIILIIQHSHTACKLNKFLKKRLPNMKQSFIHGISAFLILVYSQCVTISVTILRKGYIYKKGWHLSSEVVYYYGEYTWMSNAHLPYAIIAILALILMGTPPILLLIYPLHYRVLALLKISESRYTNLTLKLIPLEKLKPFFDSFQSSFKDEYRFFSGLYFVYRLAILISLAVSRVSTFYILLEVQLVLMLILHLICQPHKRHLHNITDGLFFGNLAIINALTVFNFTQTVYPPATSNSLLVSIWIQTLLIFSPFLLLIISIMVRLCRHFRRKKEKSNLEWDNEFPLESYELSSITDYDQRPSETLETDYSISLQQY